VRTPAAWLRSVKRRKAGIYWYTTRRHLKPGRESGYVGETWDLPRRDREHVKGGGFFKQAAKEWADLEPRRYAVSVPWWLSWKWVLRSLEAAAIVLLRPRYNWAKNPWKRHRVGPAEQVRQREIRDRRGIAGTMPTRAGRRLGVVQYAGVLCVLIGVLGWALTR
jgi:hypothetical protein